MAEIPADPVNGAIGLPSPDAGRLPIVGDSRFAIGFASLPVVRQLGLLLGLAASVALGVSVIFFLQEDDYRPIPGVSSGYDMTEVTNLLSTRQIDFRVEPVSGTILVSSADQEAARLALSGASLLGDGYRGTEMLEEEQSFGTSQFRESKLYVRGLEGELSRTIASMNGISSARVHLGLPRRTAFLRDQQRSSASVVVGIAGGRDAEVSLVKSIMNVVANAVPEMAAKDVVVVDQQGNFLSGMSGATSDESDKQLKRVQQVEQLLREKVMGVLSAQLGFEGFRVQVTADLDFTQVEETSETYDPDQPTIRSEYTMVDQRGGSLETGIPGSISNEPPAVARVPETLTGAEAEAARDAAGRSRRESTKNYETNRTIQYRRPSAGRVQRLTVAVVVDDRPVAATADAAASSEPWPEEELERMREAVKAAIGYTAARGDVLSVINADFYDPPEIVESGLPFYQEPWVVDIIKQTVGVLALLALVFGVLRPAFKALVGKAPGEDPLDLEDPLASSLVDEEELDRTLDDVVNLTQNTQSRIGSGAGYGSQLDAVRGLVADDPARVAAVLKLWVASDD